MSTYAIKPAYEVCIMLHLDSVIHGCSYRLCSHTKAKTALAQRMFSYELLPPVISKTLLQEAGVTLSALLATFLVTHFMCPAAITDCWTKRAELIAEPCTALLPLLLLDAERHCVGC